MNLDKFLTRAETNAKVIDNAASPTVTKSNLTNAMGFFVINRHKVITALREAKNLIAFHNEPGQGCPNCQGWVDKWDAEFSDDR